MKNESQNLVLAKKLNESIFSVLGQENLIGFQKAYAMACAIEELKALLTPEYMASIMQLQGTNLGFRTDKDKKKDGTKGDGYPVDIVKNCLIEAVLLGLQPYGNQFNIIAGNTYPTKAGCGYLLNNWKGLSYDLVCGLPRISNDRTSSAVEVTIKWTLNGTTKEKTIPIAIKMDAYTSVDAIIGKATRKGRAWLLSAIMGTEITDGDIEDAVNLNETSTSKTSGKTSAMATTSVEEINVKETPALAEKRETKEEKKEEVENKETIPETTPKVEKAGELPLN